jgi:hypothetical protein
MARDRLFGYELTCEGCSTYCDLDPLEVIEQNGAIPDTVHDPEKVKTLMNFWLCKDCAEGYPEGAKDFFIKEYFTEDEDFLCIHCKAFIDEDTRDEFDDTEVCLTCSPRIEESEDE